MQKKIIRRYKSHYGYRWCMLKNNLYNNDVQWIDPIDIFIKKNLNAGSVLFLDIMGLQYIKMFKNLNILDKFLKYSYGSPNKLHDNLVLMNNCDFKYISLDQISDKIIEISNRYGKNKTNIFLGFNYQHIKFNRLKHNFDLHLDLMFKKMSKNNFTCAFYKKALTNTHPYGGCFFLFTRM